MKNQNDFQSPTSQILTISWIIERVSKKLQVDFSKAFDSMNRKKDKANTTYI